MQQFKEPRQVKEFDIGTNFKKISLDILTPIVKNIEGHIAIVLEEGQRFRQDNARLKNVADFQQHLKSDMMQQQSAIQKIQEQLTRLREADEVIQSKSDKHRTLTEMQVANMHVELARKSQRIQQLNDEKDQLKGVVGDIRRAFREDIQLIQDRFSEVAQDTQFKTTTLQAKSEELQVRLQHAEEQLRQQRLKALESEQRLELYTREREDINQKMSYLYEHVFGHVSIDEFDKYKKYQTVEIKLGLDRMQKIVNDALTPEVRQFLPTIIEGVQQLKKVNKLQMEQIKLQKTLHQKYSSSLENMAVIEKRLTKQLQSVQQTNSADHKIITQLLSSESQQLLDKIKQKLDRIQKQKILDTVDVMKQGIQAKIDDQTSLIQSKLENVVKQKKEEIFQAVKNMIPQEEIDFFNMMKGFVPQMQSIKASVQQRCSYIQGLALNLQDTLQKFSNRITKVKTDLDMRQDMLLTDIRHLQKYRDDVNVRFEVVGRSLSTYAEMLILLNTYIIVFEANRKKTNASNSSHVFVSFMDGLVYEMKQQKDDDSLVYRKKNVNKLELVKASLTCFLSHVDSMFLEEFLSWKVNRPSNVFKLSIWEQLQHEKLKLQGIKDFNKESLKDQDNSIMLPRMQATLSPLELKPKEDPSTMTINTERESNVAPSSFARTTDALKQIVSSNKYKNNQRYNEESTTTTAKIRSRTRGLSQL